MAGRVDLWPVIEDVDKPDPIDPTDITPRVASASAQWELAQKVAEAIRAILSKGTIIPTKSGIRAARAGDVLVLVQRRSAIFHHIIRACKKLDLPIAGADRLRLGGEMAVRDLTALLAFLATPEDDLSLAAALRSPLLGLSEAQLFDLASGPRGYLWEKLRGSDHAQILEILTDLRNQSDYLRPYDVLERLLTRHDGRRRLIARLGAEAQEGIDELLSQALAFEVLALDPGLTVSAEQRLRMITVLAQSSGSVGMAGGQAIDLASVGKPLAEEVLRDMHRRKTGALLQGSVQMGAASGNVDDRAWQALSEFGAIIGLAFQVVDDILDVTQASDVLGKTAGKDQEQNKPTYVQLMGLEPARQYARHLHRQAHEALEASGLTDIAALSMLADKVIDRQN
jgi:hypothetical protein